MRKSGIYQYYVEGEDERSLLNTLKLDLRCIESGNFLKRQKGIKEVIYLDNKYKDTDGCIASRRLFDTCGVSYREFNKDVDKITINLNN